MAREFLGVPGIKESRGDLHGQGRVYTPEQTPSIYGAYPILYLQSKKPSTA